MGPIFFLLQDTYPGGNCIAKDTDFLKWPIVMIHADGFTLGTIVDKDSNNDQSKIYWPGTIEIPSGSVRVSMKSRIT